MKIASLNSGSNGNCYYVGTEDEALLVDAGLSCRETEKRMRAIGLSMEKVKAILISHEHGDHIKGVAVLAERYDLPVYISSATWLQGATGVSKKNVRTITAYEPVQIGGLSFLAFPKLHDAVDPHSFMISGNGINIGVFTDIGECCTNVTRYFSLCHAAFLEANYDEGLLESGRYPIYLKNRIRGGKGHLSNDQALALFLKHRPSFMSHLLLSHLSKDNNDPDLALGIFRPHAGETRISIASRYEPTELFRIAGNGNAIQVPADLKIRIKPKQMELI